MSAFAIETLKDGVLRAPAFVDLGACARFPAAPDVESPQVLASDARRGGFGLVLVAPVGEAHAPVPGTLDGQLAFARHLADPILAPTCAPVRAHDLAEIASLARAPERPRALRLTHPVADSALVRRVFEMARAHDLLVIVPSLDAALAAGAVAVEGAVATRLGLPAVPEAAEAIEVARIGELARLTRARVHVLGVFTAGGVRALERARADGALVSGATTPVHIAVDEGFLLAHPYDVRGRVWPPLPSAASRAALLDAVKRGALSLASGHAPAPKRERDLELALATPGASTLALAAQVAFALLTPEQAVRALAVEPARVLGLEEPPGRVGVDLSVRGVAADGVLEGVALAGALSLESGGLAGASSDASARPQGAVR